MREEGFLMRHREVPLITRARQVYGCHDVASADAPSRSRRAQRGHLRDAATWRVRSRAAARAGASRIAADQRRVCVPLRRVGRWVHRAGRESRCSRLNRERVVPIKRKRKAGVRAAT